MTITLDQHATGARTAPQRDRYGRYVIDGKPYTRATTIAKTLDDSYNLTRWQLRKAASGLARRPDLITSAQAHDPDNDRQVYEGIVDAALDAAQTDAAATTGTAIHRMTEDLDLGHKQLTDIPPEWLPTLTAYRSALNEARITGLGDHVEQVLILEGEGSDGWRIAGTCDRIVNTVDHGPVIADVKSSKTLDFSWLAFGIQLGIYANHTATYDYATRRRGRRIEVNRDIGLIIWLPSQGPHAGTCEIHTVDLRAGYDALLTAMEAREHRSAAKRWGTPYQPPRNEVGHLRARLDQIATDPQAAADLRAQWPLRDAAGNPTRLPSTPTLDEQAAMAAVVSRIEAAHQLPFLPHPGPDGDHLTNTNGN